MEEENKCLKGTAVNVRKQLDEFKEIYAQLRKGKATCFRDMQALRDKISKLSDAYEESQTESKAWKKRMNI